ncbi:hypothetical protein [Paraburkholderia caffeinilytica]|uniref:hypothetical protein n=1 Tax=Paraburkholderia caffeinilytica TaxID=1761016 RepID=UPI0013BE9FA0|nr:hypothetical protein [Paraburkholderia caffeinilytica]
MFKDQVECQQAIAHALTAACRESWVSIVAEVKLDGDRVDAVVSYTRTHDGKIGHLSGVPRLALFFHELARLVSAVDKGLFTSCRFKLGSDGRYSTTFEY